jgi:membrane fusion protein, adhesin transport system
VTWKDRVAGWDPSQRLIAVSAVALAIMLVWASFAQVDEVTRGTGRVIPSSQAQLVQAAEQSVVSEILVRSGERVQQGQILVRLDAATADSELGQLQAENDRLAVRADRLSGEASGSAIGCAEGTICFEERRLQQARVATARSREAALDAAVEQRRRDLREAEATADALEQSVDLAQQEVRMLEPLAARGIVPQTELLSAQRELVDVRGRLSAARQAAARASASISQAQADLQASRQDFRQQALNERSEVTTRMAVNQESIRGAEARRNRNELRAPADGVVNNVQVTTVGGVVGAGETIMQVVPVGDRLLVEARVSPRDIGFVAVGDPATVKVTAFDFATYGGLRGQVAEISADSIYDEVERVAYYRVLVETQTSYVQAHGRRYPIVPGMVTDVEILTGRKSILSYLFKPITRGLDIALTER